MTNDLVTCVSAELLSTQVNIPFYATDLERQWIVRNLPPCFLKRLFHCIVEDIACGHGY